MSMPGDTTDISDSGLKPFTDSVLCEDLQASCAPPSGWPRAIPLASGLDDVAARTRRPVQPSYHDLLF
jgi:hypothetical protein